MRERYIGAREASEVMGVHVSRIYQLARAGHWVTPGPRGKRQTVPFRTRRRIHSRALEILRQDAERFSVQDAKQTGGRARWAKEEPMQAGPIPILEELAGLVVLEQETESDPAEDPEAQEDSP